MNCFYFLPIAPINASLPPTTGRLRKVASKSISKSQTGTVNATIENVTELSGYEFTIDYDPSIVQVSDASAIVLGSFLGSTGRSVMPLTPIINNTTGQMTYTVGSFGAQTCPSGNGILANITWTAVGVGTSILDLSSAQITDPMGDPMPVTLIDGQIVVTDTHFADLDGDGDVDIVDIQKVAAHYGSQEGDPDWDPKYDIDGDGDVDIVDVQKVAAWYGQDVSGKVTTPLGKARDKNDPVHLRMRPVFEEQSNVVDLYVENAENLAGFELSFRSAGKLPEIQTIQIGDLFSARGVQAHVLGPLQSEDGNKIGIAVYSIGKREQQVREGNLVKVVFTEPPGPFQIQDCQMVDQQGHILPMGSVSIESPEEPAYLPNTYLLYQNYPNPFNPSTTISYSIHKKGQVQLKIYDLLGKCVTTLVDQFQTPGQYQIDWQAKGLSSGVYFCRLTTGKSVQTIKLLYLQ